MKKHALALTVIALLAMAGLAFVSLSKVGGAKAAERVLASRRIAAVTTYAKRKPNLEDITGDRALAGPDLARFRDTDTDDEYTVDDRGVLKAYVNTRVLKGARNTTATQLSDARLLGAATDYIVNRLPAFDLGSARSRIERRVVGMDGQGRPTEYETNVTFTEYLRGVPTCNFVRMLMDGATGEVLILNADAGTLPTSATPTVSQEQAIDTVAGALEMPRRSSEECELRVWREPVTHAVRLIWRIKLATGDHEFGGNGMALVDAETGDILLISDNRGN